MDTTTQATADTPKIEYDGVEVDADALDRNGRACAQADVTSRPRARDLRQADRRTGNRVDLDRGCAIRIEQLRLLVLKTAWLIDQHGAQAARKEIAAIKVAAPDVALRCSTARSRFTERRRVRRRSAVADLVLRRILRIADGPDDVPRRTISRLELAAHSRT